MSNLPLPAPPAAWTLLPPSGDLRRAGFAAYELPPGSDAALEAWLDALPTRDTACAVVIGEVTALGAAELAHAERELGERGLHVDLWPVEHPACGAVFCVRSAARRIVVVVPRSVVPDDCPACRADVPPLN